MEHDERPDYGKFRQALISELDASVSIAVPRKANSKQGSQDFKQPTNGLSKLQFGRQSSNLNDSFGKAPNLEEEFEDLLIQESKSPSAKVANEVKMFAKSLQAGASREKYQL